MSHYRTLSIVALALDLALTRHVSAGANSVAPSTEMRRAEIRTVEQSMDKLVDRGAALFFLARRYAQVGESDKALAILKECMSLQQGFDPSSLPQFESLHANPQFQSLAKRAQQAYPPVDRAHVAFMVPEKDLFPEGLASDPARHVLYMGTVRQKVIRITAQGAVGELAKPTGHRIPEMNGIKVDPKDHSLWIATADDDSSELLHLGADGTLLAYFSPPGAGPHELNDLALRGPHELYITDTVAHQAYRFDREHHSFEPLTLNRPLLYPNGITLSDDGNWLYIADILGVIRLDLRTSTTREVNPGQHDTLAGIDGLYWHKGSLIGIQYGSGPYRVARWLLSEDGLSVRSTRVLEYRTPLVSSPTTGAIADGKLYFMANTGIDNYNNGKVVDPKRLEPIHIAVVDLD